MTSINPNKTVDEFHPAADNDITLIAEDDSNRPKEEFVSYDEIRHLIGADADVLSMEQFSGIRVLGSGGLGSVHAATEKVLNREIAIKILRPMYRKRKRPVGRMVREAIVTAQIEHPNIVPVHAMGVLDDVGVYFTMKKVSGETLQQVLQKLESGDKDYLERYTPSRLLEIFISICQGVAYAHSKGVIHRDLKPSNIMLGEYGEVMVMDWGLVKYAGEEEVVDNFGVYSESNGEKMLTLDGTIAGTPLFMSPEQATGRAAEVDQQSDVYSLGVILYCILTYKQSPFKESMDIKEVLSQVANSAFTPPRKAVSRNVPRELNAICMKAMSRKKCNRYASVLDLVKDIRCYIEGYPVSAYRAPLHHRFFLFCGRNRLVTSMILIAIITLLAYLSVTRIYDNLEYSSYIKTADFNFESADQARMRAYSIYRQLRRQDENNMFGMGRTMEERRLESQLKYNKGMFENHYNTALLFYSKIEKFRKDDPRVMKGISDTFNRLFEYALLTDDIDDMAKIDALIRMRGRQIGYLNDDARNIYFRAKAMLNNRGTLKISTDGDREISLYKVDLQDGTNTPIKQGKSPLEEKNLSGGTYLAIVKDHNGTGVKFPLVLGPGQNLSTTLAIPEKIPAGMVFIPAGEFIYGQDDNGPLRRMAMVLESFFIKKHEVTFQEFIAFWLTLKGSRREEFRGKRLTESREFINIWDESGKLAPGFSTDLPVVGIPREAAEAFCRWKSISSGGKYRLPTALEWEKAARGPDGRSFVWGNNIRYDAALNGGADKAILNRYKFSAPPGSFPADVSVYGVYDLAGNVREYTCNSHPMQPCIKGASRFTGPEFLYCWQTSFEIMYLNDIGFRYVFEP